MKPLRIHRDLKLKDVELFYVTRGFVGRPICYFLIMDLKRPSKLNDYPYIGIDSEEEFESRSNFIKVIVLSESSLESDLGREIVEEIAGGFLENKDDCDWNASFELIDNFYNERNREPVLIFAEQILAQYGFDIKLTTIPEEKFNFLSQD